MGAQGVQDIRALLVMENDVLQKRRVRDLVQIRRHRVPIGVFGPGRSQPGFVALDEGGARETVADGVTGVLVDTDSAEAFAAGLARLRDLRLDPAAIRDNARRFSRERFMSEFKAAAADLLETSR